MWSVSFAPPQPSAPPTRPAQPPLTTAGTERGAEVEGSQKATPGISGNCSLTAAIIEQAASTVKPFGHLSPLGQSCEYMMIARSEYPYLRASLASCSAPLTSRVALTSQEESPWHSHILSARTFLEII